MLLSAWCLGFLWSLRRLGGRYHEAYEHGMITNSIEKDLKGVAVEFIAWSAKL
jgi:hypothetical protein